MSLKAKLEAVVYAAEEPVTLAQLAALFSAEALEWKAEQQSAAAACAQSPETMPLLGEELEYLGLEQTPAFYPVAPPAAPLGEQCDTGTESAGPAGAEPAPEPVEGEATDADSEAAPTGEDPAIDAEAESKRSARVRDREVKGILRQLLDELIASYASDDRGVEIREIAGGYRVGTKPECHDAVRLFIKSLKPPMKLSLPALETLAVIAYKQPVTAPEVNEIRGVDSSGVFGSLLARKLITTAGRKPVIGRPILYKTTKEFLLRFGLKDVAELPSMEEFEKMAAIELDEAADEVEQGAGDGPGAEPEFDENASEEPEVNASASEAFTDPGEAQESVADPAGSSSIQQQTTPAEIAPDQPATTEQAETETSPHD